jgi:aryl-alcohol dehydrogenase-like predicted oxidoreductase
VELLADSFRRAEISNHPYVSLQYVDGMSDPAFREKLHPQLESRLQILGWDHAPLFLTGVGNNHPSLQQMEAALVEMNKLKAEGLIGNIGVSCHELDKMDDLAQVIENCDLVDYLLVRYNWKCQQAAHHLFPAALTHNIGVVIMKVFCWDCGPGFWDRRISFFEPTDMAGREHHPTQLNAAQRSLLWCIRNSPCATTVPSINAMWEAKQLLAAIAAFPEHESVDTSDFVALQNRLDDPQFLSLLSEKAESADIRARAQALIQRK